MDERIAKIGGKERALELYGVTLKAMGKKESTK